MRFHLLSGKRRTAIGWPIAIWVAVTWSMSASLPRVPHVVADETQAAGASDSFRGQPVADWVAKLRDGPVDELVAAGPDALVVWEQAARDGEAVNWVRHCLQIHFRDAPWTARVFVAMLDAPDTSDRHFALMHLQASEAARKEAAAQVLKKAREWLRNGDRMERGLTDAALEFLVKCKPAPEGTAELVRELWASYEATAPEGTAGANQYALLYQGFQRWKLLSVLSSLGQSGVDTFIDLHRDNGVADMDSGSFMLDANAETIQGLFEASRSEDTVRRRLAALLMRQMTTGSRFAEHRKPLIARACELLKDTDADVRSHALDIVRDLVDEQEARAAIPDLARHMNSPEHRWAAAQVLARFGTIALEHIRNAAHCDDPETRAAACLALCTMKPFPKGEVGLLLTLTDDLQPLVRNYAMHALSSSHLEDPAIVARLVKAVHDVETRDWAVRALGNLGPAARGAVPELEAALQDDDLRARLQAAEALWDVSQDVDKVLPVALAIAENDQGITVGGYYATTKIVDGKRVEMHHPYRTPLAARAVELLGKMGPAAKPATGLLESYLKHPDQGMQRAAAQAIAKIAPSAEDGLPRVVTFGRPAERPVESAGMTRQSAPASDGAKTDLPREKSPAVEAPKKND